MTQAPAEVVLIAFDPEENVDVATDKIAAGIAEMCHEQKKSIINPFVLFEDTAESLAITESLMDKCPNFKSAVMVGSKILSTIDIDRKDTPMPALEDLPSEDVVVDITKSIVIIGEESVVSQLTPLQAMERFYVDDERKKTKPVEYISTGVTKISNGEALPGTTLTMHSDLTKITDTACVSDDSYTSSTKKKESSNEVGLTKKTPYDWLFDEMVTPPFGYVDLRPAEDVTQDALQPMPEVILKAAETTQKDLQLV